MAEQCYRGLQGHPTELKRIREVASKLQGYDEYQEEIGYSAEELAEAANSVPFEADSGSKVTGMPGAGGPAISVEAGVTSKNSPNPKGSGY